MIQHSQSISRCLETGSEIVVSKEVLMYGYVHRRKLDAKAKHLEKKVISVNL